jgi:hypothetical protein
MGEIGATEALARGPLGDRGINASQVGFAGPAAPLDDASGHFADTSIELSCHVNLAS